MGLFCPWYCHASVLQESKCPLSELSNEVLWVFVSPILFEKIEEIYQKTEVESRAVQIHLSVTVDSTHWKISLQQLTCVMGGSLPHQHHFHANLAKILSTEFHFFLLWSEIVWEPKMLEKQTISHFKALFCSNLFFKVQTCILKRESYASFLAGTSFNFAFFRRT